MNKKSKTLDLILGIRGMISRFDSGIEFWSHSQFPRTLKEALDQDEEISSLYQGITADLQELRSYATNNVLLEDQDQELAKLATPKLEKLLEEVIESHW